LCTLYSHSDTFQFYTGGFHVHQEPYQLQAGDKFRTTCYYKDGKVFDEGSQEEMCVGFLMYYPAKKFAGFPFICPYPGQSPCAEEYVSTDLSGYEELGRTFGTPSQATENPTSEAQSNANEQVTPTSSSNAHSMHCLFVLVLSSAAMFITYE